jgi:CDI immunity proteins
MTISIKFDRSASLEGLERDVWADPPESTTSMVRNIHELRRRPIGSLSPWELARLIGQDVGLPWTLPLGLKILRDSAPQQAETGYYDDDLLTAVLTRKTGTWSTFPEYAHEVEEILRILVNPSPYVRDAIDQFHAALPN